ncbi:molybdopterin oxidoreductase family protein [Amycolatopsis sp. NPDC004368]
MSATNPAVSLPDLHRIRSILAQDRLFLVVQDAFRTETAELADVVLPAAIWGEKTGTFTNADRTVHLSEKAVEPPGQARADLDIFLDYARRMDLRDRAGEPFPACTDAESAFEAWKRASAGRPCDYSGLSYGKLREVSGVRWPCTPEHPDGTERLYTDGKFFAHPDYCESYGRDLVTGAPTEPGEYRAANPDGKAMLKAAGYLEPHETPDADHPWFLINGRTIHHFHTRTKTGRTPQLDAAAPEVWLEVSEVDAEAAGLSEGDLAEVSTPRGAVRAHVRVGGIRPGVVFLPFHYGYWDVDHAAGKDGDRAANELTFTDWDPVSKQPLFKVAAAALRKVGDEPPAPSPRAADTAVHEEFETEGAR